MEQNTAHTELSSQENIMGTMPVGKLLISMSLPMIFSMLVQSLYNIVDSIFVARLAEDALTAVTLALPLQSVMTAITIGLIVGVNAVLSKYLGEKNAGGVSRTACNGLLLEWITFILFLMVGLFAVEPFFRMQASDPVIYQYGVQYATIVNVFSFGVVNQVIMERLLISTGKTTASMASLLTGAIVNMILDPIMIFGLLGFPALGIRGAAYVSILAYNFGAKKKERIYQSIRICMITSIVITAAVMLLFLIWPQGLLGLFGAQEQMMRIGTIALRTISFSIPVTGVTIILGAVLQSLNNSGKEFAISMERIVVLLASAWLLSLTGRLEMVWWAFPLTEVVALVMGLVFWQKVNAQYIKPIANESENS